MRTPPASNFRRICFNSSSLSCGSEFLVLSVLAFWELRRRQIELQHLRRPEDIRIVRDGAVEYAPTPVVADPGEAVVIVLAEDVAAGLSFKFGLVHVDAQKHANPVSRIGLL